MKNTHRLRELLLAAISASNGKNVGRWEDHLTDAFNAFLGGEDVFLTGPRYFSDGFLLLTVGNRDKITFGSYQCQRVMPVGTKGAIREYHIIGQGSFATFRAGNPADVRVEIERSYCDAIEMLGTTEFRDVFRKNVPYVAAEDPGLINIANGVIDHTRDRGMADDPLVLTLPVGSRLYVRQYIDIRRYHDFEALMNGLFGAWNTLASFDDRDWDTFSRVVRVAFQ